MKICLWISLCLGSLPMFMSVKAEESTSKSVFGPQNNSLVDNFNVLAASSKYHEGQKNATGSIPETKVKEENIKINRTLVHRKSSELHSVNINNVTEKKTIINNDEISDSENKSTNKSRLLHTNTLKRKIRVDKFINSTKMEENEEKSTNHSSVTLPWPKEREKTTKLTKYPSFSISPRSMKSNLKVKVLDKNEDYGRDCFEDLRKYVGSRACYKVQCIDSGVRFLIKDEESASLKPIRKFKIGRELKMLDNCISLPSARGPPSEICIKWRDMKWSRTKFRGCVSATAPNSSDKIRIPKITCYVLNCEEYKWGNKWFIPTKSPPLAIKKPPEKNRKSPTLSNPSQNPLMNSKSNSILSKDQPFPPNQSGVNMPFNQKGTTSQVFDYIETLPPSNYGHQPASQNKQNQKQGSKSKPENNPKLGNKFQLDKKPQQSKNITKPGNMSKPEISPKPENKPKPKPVNNRKQQNNFQPGNKPHKNNKLKPGNKPLKNNELKPGNKIRPGKNHQQGNKPKLGNMSKPGNKFQPGKKHQQGKNIPKPGNKSKPGNTKPKTGSNGKPGNKFQPGNKAQQNNKPKQWNKPKPDSKQQQSKLKPSGPKIHQEGEQKQNGNLLASKSSLWTLDLNNKNQQESPIQTTKIQTSSVLKQEQKKEVLDSHEVELRVGEINVLTPIQAKNQKGVLGQPDVFPFIPQDSDTQILYILEPQL